MSKREMTQKDIDVLCMHMLVAFKARKDIDYQIREYEYGYSFDFNSINNFDGVANCLSLINALFSNFGYTISSNSLSNTHTYEPVSENKYLEKIDEIKKLNPYNVHENTFDFARDILKKFIFKMNSSNKFLGLFNNGGNIEIFSDVNHCIWIEAFLKGKRISVCCNDTCIILFCSLIKENVKTDIQICASIEAAINFLIQD